MKYTVDMIEKAKALRAEGWSYARIVKEVGGSESGVKFHLNPVFAERKRERWREYMLDPVFADRWRKRKRERRAEFKETYGISEDTARRMTIPGERELYNSRNRERMQDPVKREEKNRRDRERMQDPVKREENNRRWRERMQDPVKREERNRRERERRAQVKAEKEKQNAS